MFQNKINITVIILTFILVIESAGSLNILAQNKIAEGHFRTNYAKSENQTIRHKNLIKSIHSHFAADPDFRKKKEWYNIFKEIDLAFYKDSVVYDILVKILSDTNKYPWMLRTGIETAITLYPNDFYIQIKSIYDVTNSEIVFPYAVCYLLSGDSKKITSTDIFISLESKFPDWKDSPSLRMLNFNLKNTKKEQLANRPSLKELINHKIQTGKTIIYSFHRADRQFQGITIIKKPDGTFVRNEDSSLFYIPQLALSTSNLPGYLSNGNTPQGIFSIVGWYVSPTESIGPTPIVLTRSPFEVTTKKFYHGKQTKNKWGIDDYRNLLPKSWQNYTPVYESYYAGQSGRKLIIMHGSADNLDYYKNKPYYPLSPSKGCLTAMEIWDSDTGKLLESDQVKLINAFYSTKQTKGFLVVVEIDDKQKPVSIDEIIHILK